MSETFARTKYSALKGSRFGSLVFVGVSPERGDNNRVLGEFMCDCGRVTTLSVARVVNQTSKSHCGCKTDRGSHRTHGMRYTPEYSSWQAMKNRCLDPENKDFPRWGAKGVRVYSEWVDSFQAFYAHVGPRPSGTTLDRINSKGDYVPGNVRWATASQQQRNRASACVWNIKGEIFETAEEAAEFFNVSKHTVWRWTRGEFDHRRGTLVPPRGDCHAVPRY